MTAENERRPGSPPARAVSWIAVRLWFLVVPGFVALAVWAGLHAHAFETGSAVLNLIPKDSPALSAERDSVRLFDVPAGSDVIAVQRDPNGLSADAQRRSLERAAAVARGHDASGASLAIPLIDVPKAPASHGDMTTVVTHLVFGDRFAPGERVRGAHVYLHGLDAPVGVTGVTPARIEEGNLILDRLGLIELLTVIAVATIVVVMFRSPGAALITLSAIGVAFPITLWALTEIANRTGAHLPQEVEPLVVALLLGVVTDYAVFFLSEFRDRMRGGADARSGAFDAAVAVVPIVFIGGVILSVSLLALRASSLGFFRDLGPALAATVAVAMLVSFLFVPALISLFGRFAVWPSVRQREPGEPAARSALRARLAHAAAGKPLAAVIALVCVAGLVAAGLQLRGMALGVDVDLGPAARQRVPDRREGRPVGLCSGSTGTARGDRPQPRRGAVAGRPGQPRARTA